MIVYIKKHENDNYYVYINKKYISYSDSIQLIYIKNSNITDYLKLIGISLNTIEEILS